MSESMMIVEGWSLVTVDGESDPRVMDDELAKALQFSDPVTIRKLIKRLMESGELQDVHVVPMTETTSMPNGGIRKTEFSAFMLNEEQAYLVTMHSRTKKALDVRKQIAAVFKAWRHRELVPATITTAITPAPHPAATSLTTADIRSVVTEIVTAVVHAIQGHPPEVMSLGGTPMSMVGGDTVGEYGDSYISSELKSAAAMFPADAYASQRAQLENEFRQLTNYPRVRGASFARFPRARWHQAVSVLRAIRQRTERTVAMFRGPSPQTSLFPMGPKSRRRRPSAPKT